MEYHNIAPVYDENSKILILGSFPSVKSREVEFFYGHPQNRFWKLMTLLFNWKGIPATVEEKKEMLLQSRVAVWDVIASCEIEGSSDVSIKNVLPNDIRIILDFAPIQKIICNGAKSYEMYNKYIFPITKRKAVKLPSTSPANAAKSLEKLAEIWKEEIKDING